jgi:nucleoside-diphosphate-sugar epimerase
MLLSNKSFFITGASGFVGKNLIAFLGNNFKIIEYERDSDLSISADVVIHLAGKAHDLRNVTNSIEYFNVNTELTKKIFDEFLASKANVFITLSSVKAVADKVEGILTEDKYPNPFTDYGKSKMMAERYILSKEIPKNKKFYILRPSMIHGPGNKGNLNLLYKIIEKGFPWPLGAFHNKRSFCSIDNLLFVLNELYTRNDIPSGIYNICDDEPISTNDLVRLIAESKNNGKALIWALPKFLIQIFTLVGDFFNLPINSNNLQKLTESYIVSNDKISLVIGKPFPVTSREGLIKTFKSFN